MHPSQALGPPSISRSTPAAWHIVLCHLSSFDMSCMLSSLQSRQLLLQDGQIAVVVGTITDDVRVYDVAKLRVCALRFTATARARIIKVGA